MYRFYQDPAKGTYHEISLDEKNFSIKTEYGEFKWYHGYSYGRASNKAYKKLETAQRNFEKRCKEWEDKGYILSDPFAPLRYRKAIDAVKNGESDSLSVTIYHEKNWEEICQLKKLTSLTISSERNRVAIPEAMTELENLEYLNISYQVPNLPESLGNLKKLKTLKIYNCPAIKALPDSIVECDNLESLTLKAHASNITTFPKEIGKLKKLRSIDLKYSKFTTFPPSIGQCDNLEKINASKCRELKSLPEEFGQLKNLKTIDFSESGMSTFPDCIAEIKSLEEINWSRTKFSSLPKNIGNLVHLKKLNLNVSFDGMNGTNKLPDSFFNLTNLEELDLSFNGLTEVSEGFQKLTKLKDLKLVANPITNVPKDLLAKGKKAIFQHFGWLAEDEIFEVESKLSEEKKVALREKYQERFDRFYKKYDPNAWRKAPVEDIMAFLKFESDNIPHFEGSIARYKYGAMPYFWTIFSPIDEWTEVEHRMMMMLSQNGWGVSSNYRYAKNSERGFNGPFFNWYVKSLEEGNEPEHQAVVDILEKYGQGETAFEDILSYSHPYLVVDDKPSKLGKVIIERFKKEPKKLLDFLRAQGTSKERIAAMNVIDLLILFARKEFEPLVDYWFFHEYQEEDKDPYYFFSTYNIRKLCEPDPNKYEDFLLRVHKLNVNHINSAQLGIYFQIYFGDKYKDLILKDLCDEDLFFKNINDSFKYDNFHNPGYGTSMINYFDWMTTLYNKEVKEIVLNSFLKEANKYIQYLPILVKNYGADSLPVFEILLEEKIELAKVFPSLKEIDYSSIHSRLWDILKSDQKAERTLAINELVRLYKSKELLKEIPELLKAKKAGDRVGPHELLMAIDDKNATKLLKERFKEEQDSVQRNMIIQHLQKLGEDKFLQKEILAGFDWAKANKKLQKPVKKWLDESVLPPLHWKKGKKADAELVRYLFFRQKDVAQEWYGPSPEVQLILNEIDTAKGGDFAAKLLEITLEKDGLKATSKPVIGIISALGDDQLIEPLKAYTIRRNNVVAPQMMGYIASDKAARALDAIMLHYKTKYPNVRGAAQSGFDRIADQMGLSRFELMDKMIPDFGFVDLFKTFEINGATWRAFINEDLKLSYLNDIDEIKKSLPTKTPKEIKAEVKELNKEIRTIAKNQKSSLEFNLIAQRRWPAADWKAHFMGKPLTFALAQSLVWGVYEDGKLTEIFNVNQDQTLQNIELDEIELPEKASVGLVHPIDLTNEQLKTWQEFIYDEEITQPFEQINRKVISVPKDQEKTTVIEQYKGEEVSDYRFRSVMGKRGWKRGSVVDSGMVDNYKKTYEAFGIDVFVKVEEMYIHLGDYSENVNLDDIYFVKSGSVQTGSYVYDTYKNDEDERLFKLKDLPPLVYSETMYDIEVLLKNH